MFCKCSTIRMFGKVLVTILLTVVMVAGTPTIKSRADWQAVAPKEKVSIGSKQPYVIIHHTETPSCDNQNECAKRVRSIQNYHMVDNDWADIGYNFLVDPQGIVYTGRGWGIRGAHSPLYNRRSIGISVIGNYMNSPPNDKAIQAVKELISLGVETGELSENYTLFGHKQTRNTNCPGNAFYKKIITWPHWETSDEELKALRQSIK